MSIKLMSAIFETEFIDLPLPEADKDGKERRTKASTAKLVLLAIADHANDEGESAYPGLTRLELKTGLSRQGVIDAISALKYNGILCVDEIPSKLHTNNYTLNLSSFPCLRADFDGSQATLLVKPLDQPSQATLLEVVKPLDLNHPLTTNQPSNAKQPQPLSKEKALLLPDEKLITMKDQFTEEEWTWIVNQRDVEKTGKTITAAYERAMGYNPLSWSGKLERLKKFLLTKQEAEIRQFAEWSKAKYSPLSPAKARLNPDMVVDLWPQAFTADPADNPYRNLPTVAELEAAGKI